eukprot:GEMP01039950.1.p1 GENE.GEMP01039950.1~~GEMP01039950.1.p1  ORF type:complete len:286 (+),score=69.64 GEMP01039950.1:145-1002(+)
MGLEFDTPTVDTRAYNSAVEKEKEMVAMCTASHFGDDFLHINKGEPLYVRKEHGALRFEIQMDMRCYWARASCGQYGWVRVDKVGTKKLYHWMMQHEIKEALDTQAQNEKAQQLIEGMGLGEALKKLSVSVVQRVTLELFHGANPATEHSAMAGPAREPSARHIENDTEKHPSLCTGDGSANSLENASKAHAESSSSIHTSSTSEYVEDFVTKSAPLADLQEDIRTAIVLADFNHNQYYGEDYLVLNCCDRVEVIGEDNFEGWVYGRLRGSTVERWLPKSYLQFD